MRIQKILFVVFFIVSIVFSPALAQGGSQRGPEALIDSEKAGDVLETDIEFLEGSGIVLERLSSAQIDRLVLLGRVWGYLKHHHPAVTSGTRHWDFELFRMLPAYLEANDPKRFLVEWIDELGELEPCDPCAGLPENLHVAPDLDWLADESLLGTDLSRTLQQVHQRRSPDTGQFFVNLAAEVGFADFSRELAYEGVGLDDSGYRLLTLYRWWNIIEYWFPYRYMMDEDWEDVLVEFLPRIVLADNSDDYRRELLAFAARIDDGHVGLTNTFDVLPPAGTCNLPVAVRFIEQQPVVVAVAEESASALRVGDVIRSIDGRVIDELIAQWKPYYSASNETARLHFMSFFLGKGPCGLLELTVQREGVLESLQVERQQRQPLHYAHDRPGETIRLLTEKVAYLTLSSFDPANIDDYLEVMSGVESLVIDIRNYPAAFAVYSFGKHLVDRPTDMASFTMGQMNAPGAFVWGPTLTLQPEEPAFTGRIAIVVDEASMSQAEGTAKAFRVAPDSVVVGNTTAGANGNVASFPLPGGLSSSISGIGAYYADRRPMQRIGIVADIPAAPTIEGFRAGRDEILEAALRHLLGEDLSEPEIRDLARRRPLAPAQ